MNASISLQEGRILFVNKERHSFGEVPLIIDDTSPGAFHRRLWYLSLARRLNKGQDHSSQRRIRLGDIRNISIIGLEAKIGLQEKLVGRLPTDNEYILLSRVMWICDGAIIQDNYICQNLTNSGIFFQRYTPDTVEIAENDHFYNLSIVPKRNVVGKWAFYLFTSLVYRATWESKSKETKSYKYFVNPEFVRYQNFSLMRIAHAEWEIYEEEIINDGGELIQPVRDLDGLKKQSVSFEDF